MMRNRLIQKITFFLVTCGDQKTTQLSKHDYVVGSLTVLTASCESASLYFNTQEPIIKLM